MCGIVCVFGNSVDIPKDLLTHRGPDDYASKKLGQCQIDYYRLKINDLTDAGMQPFQSERALFACNGEIYNHKQFRKGTEKSNSDCEVLLGMIEEEGIIETLNKINGDYALVYTTGSRVVAARDLTGVRPLFYVRYAKNSIAFASEVKALLFLEKEVKVFPPGHIYDSFLDDFVCHKRVYWDPTVKYMFDEKNAIKNTLIDAVNMRIENTERDIGFLLSGGLDSSLIASIAQRKLGTIKTFSIGTVGSPDLAAARIVAKYLQSDHTELTFTAEDGIAVIGDVIYSLESYDTTTVRASIPMWLLCKYIKEHTTCRYIFSGEGSDELFGGYLYFHYAPTIHDFSLENTRRLKLIHQFDGLRADRCAGAHGLDLIVPFLDKNLIELGMTMNQETKVPSAGKPNIEKRVLREAFETFLPPEILWRQKDGMSDAVGKAWVEGLKHFLNTQTSQFKHDTVVMRCHGHNPCLTREESTYRSIFWDKFGIKNDDLLCEIWRPKWTDQTDPSGAILASGLVDIHGTASGDLEA